MIQMQTLLFKAELIRTEHYFKLLCVKDLCEPGTFGILLQHSNHWAPIGTTLAQIRCISVMPNVYKLIITVF